jgi:hypothetical protein
MKEEYRKGAIKPNISSEEVNDNEEYELSS